MSNQVIKNNLEFNQLVPYVYLYEYNIAKKEKLKEGKKIFKFLEKLSNVKAMVIRDFIMLKCDYCLSS